MCNQPEDTGYRAYFFEQLKKKTAELRAEAAADASIEWMSYPEAVQFVLPVLFGKDWVGFPPEQEHVVQKIGEAHRNWHEHSSRKRERDEQIARAERWLLVNGLIEERRGHRRVQAERLRKALADDVMREWPPVESEASPAGSKAPATVSPPAATSRMRSPKGHKDLPYDRAKGSDRSLALVTSASANVMPPDEAERYTLLWDAGDGRENRG